MKVARFAVMLLAVLSPCPTLSAQHSEHVDGEEIRVAEDDQPSREDHPATASDESDELRSAAEGIVEKTNAFRESHDLPPVQPNPQLTETAVYFAKFMARTGKYGHAADDKRPSQRAAEHGYEYCIVAENIAFRSTGSGGSALAGHFVDGWIESKGHRENMLKEYVTQTGVAVARDDKSGYLFAVQMFGRPKAAAIEFTITNKTADEVEYQVITDGEKQSLTLPPRSIVTHTRCRPPSIKLTESDSVPLQVAGKEKLLVRRDGQQHVLVEQDQPDRSGR